MILALCAARVALAVMAGGRLAAAQLSIPTPPPAATRNVTLAVMLDAQGASVSGVQFDITFPPATVSLLPSTGSAAGAAAKSVHAAEVAPGRWRFIVLGFNQSTLSNGPVLSLLAMLSAGAGSAASAVGIAGATAVAPDGGAVKISATGTSVSMATNASLAPALDASGVRNGASFLAGSVAPGEVLQLAGAGIGPEGAAGGPATAVFFDGVSAPLLYALPGVIGVVTPYAVAGKRTTRIQVARGALVQAEAEVPVSATAPGLFTVSGTGAGPGAILNQDYSLNTASAPAARGSVIMLYATGLGALTPAEADGETVHATPALVAGAVSVAIGGRDAPVLYAGSAPGIISGVVQINARVPEEIGSGAQTVLVTAGGVASQGGVTVCVK